MSNTIALSGIFIEHGVSRYVLQSYQRGYEWEKNHIDDFWYDLVQTRDNTDYVHFYGNIYTTTSEKDKNINTIADGQQRLVSASLLLICARDIFHESDDPHASKYKASVQNRLYASDNGVDLNLKKPILTLSRSNKNFFDEILTTETPDKLTELKKSHEVRKNDTNKNLLNAYKILYTNLQEIRKKSGLEGVNKLVRAMLTKFEIQQNHLEDLTTINRRFHLMNFRGLALEPPDLVKNFLFEILAKDGGDDYLDKYDEIWNDMRTNITGKDEASVAQEQFFHQYLTAVGRYRLKNKPERIPGKDVYKCFKKLIEDVDHGSKTSREVVVELINELYSWSDILKRIRKSEGFDKQDTIQYYLKKIRDIKAVFVYPALLAGYEQYWNKDDKKSFEKLVRLCFICHIRVKTVGTSIGVSQYESIMNKITDNIRAGTPIVDIIDTLNRNDDYPTDEKFLTNLKGFTTSNSKLAIALLEEIDSDYSHAPIGLSDVTLEHIMPQSFEKWYGANFGTDNSKTFKNDKKEEHTTYLKRLGNQTLLSEKLNKEASAKPFKDKLVIYKLEDKKHKSTHKIYEITRSLFNKTQWTKEDIDSRDEEFRKILVKRINLNIIS